MSEDSTRCVVHDYWYYYKYKDSCPFCDAARKDATIASLREEAKRNDVYFKESQENINGLIDENNSLKAEVERLTRVNNDNLALLSEMTGAANKYEDEMDSLRLDKEELQKLKEFMGKSSTAMFSEYSDMKARLDQAEAEVERLTQPCDNNCCEVIALRTRVDLLTEQNKALEESAKSCPSCGFLLPNHADYCGRHEAVISAIRVRTETASLAKKFNDEVIKHLSDKLQHTEWELSRAKEHMGTLRELKEGYQKELAAERGKVEKALNLLLDNTQETHYRIVKAREILAK